jgi:hypothetical protein
MHHKKAAGSPERAIKGIGKTNIKGEISTRHAMTDYAMDEIYGLVDEAFRGGQEKVLPSE